MSRGIGAPFAAQYAGIGDGARRTTPDLQPTRTKTVGVVPERLALCHNKNGRLHTGVRLLHLVKLNNYQPMILFDMLDSSGLQNLLDLAGSIIEQGDGYWIKIEAWTVVPTREVPHGIRYAMTLHEPYGKRILGYDNAHAVKPPKKFKFAGQRLAYDHKHRHVSDKGVPYAFVDAH